MMIKYFTEDSKTKLYTLTEEQLRDHEIITAFMVMRAHGIDSSAAIRELANDYIMSVKNVERIVYPIPK